MTTKAKTAQMQPESANQNSSAVSTPKGSTSTKQNSKSKASKTNSGISRMQALGIILKKSPNITEEALCKQADALYSKQTGKGANLKETRLCYSYVKRFLKGYLN